MKKGFTLIEIAVVLVIIGILIGLSSSAWTAVLAYLREIKHQENIKKFKQDLLEHSKDFDELKVYFPSSLLKRNYPKAYVIYSQAYMKTYPQPCNYDLKSSKNVDEKFLTLYYLGKKIDKVLYIVVLNSFKKVNEDFTFLDEHTLKINNLKLKFFYITLDDLKFKICPKTLENKYFIDYVKKKNTIIDYSNIKLIPIYPKKYTYLKYSTPEGLFNLDENQEYIKVNLQEPIAKVSFYLYDKNFNLIDKRNEFIAYLNENLIENEIPINVTNLDNNLYKISWKVENLTKYECLIDFGDGKNIYLPNCEKFNYVLHKYVYEGEFTLKMFITNSKIIYYNETSVYVDIDNLRPKINFIKSKQNITFFIVDNAKDENKCSLYLNSRLFFKNDNCKKISLNIFEKEYPCSIKLFVEDKFGATNIFSNILE